MKHTIPTLTIVLILLFAPTPAQADRAPWPMPVLDHVPVEPGEHPRLFFRRADLPALRAKAQTPEGRAMITRLRVLLGGGETMPEHHRPVDVPFGDRTPPIDLPLGAYTISHAAGFGLLYQLTEDPKYAELGLEAFEWAFRGIRDRDRTGRYGWEGFSGHLRAGPSLGWYAVAYDLLYDGWDEETRIRIARAIQNFDQGRGATLPNLSGGASHYPFSNHWSMQVGGATLALLAIKNDPGVDMDIVGPALEANRRAMIRVMTEGFGDGGFFAEGDGTGSMAAHIVFLPALQAWRTAAGHDFITPRPHAQWIARRWFFLSNLHEAPPTFAPKRGGYPHNVWDREGISGGGYFAHAFGILPKAEHPGLLWLYNQSLREHDNNNGTPFDTASLYPHTAVLAFINFPFDLEAENPTGTWPHRNHDTEHRFYSWRNRYQDENDVIISVLGQTTTGYIKASAEEFISIFTQGEMLHWGTFSRGIRRELDRRPQGGSVITFGDGGSFAVDFSGKSGRDVLLVMHGPGAPPENQHTAGDHTFSLLFLGDGETPTPTVQGNTLRVGEQIISIEEDRIKLAD